MTAFPIGQFQWYGVVPHKTPLEQGDLIDNVPIPIPPMDVLSLDEIKPEKEVNLA